ncbi:MAG: outer membrane lipoprotein chaperone LolA [Acidobacteriota bacterium]
MRILTFALALLVGPISAAAQTAALPPAQEVAAALQKKYDGVRDFTADFVHDSEGGVLRKKQTERGVVQVKKPGKMRWDYKTPEPKVFVSDGRRIYLYVPADNQVITSPVPDSDQATTAVLFLVGKGSLTRDFTVSYTDGGGPDSYALRLQPRQPERDYDWLQIVVDRRTLQIRTLSAADTQGGRSTFQFSNYKENVGLTDKTFEFKIPRGADVTNNGSPSR